MYSAVKIYKMSQLLWLNEIVELSLEEESLVNSKNDDDIPILAAVTTYMRRDLHQNQGFYDIRLMNLKATLG